MRKLVVGGFLGGLAAALCATTAMAADLGYGYGPPDPPPVYARPGPDYGPPPPFHRPPPPRWEGEYERPHWREGSWRRPPPPPRIEEDDEDDGPERCWIRPTPWGSERVCR